MKSSKCIEKKKKRKIDLHECQLDLLFAQEKLLESK